MKTYMSLPSQLIINTCIRDPTWTFLDEFPDEENRSHVHTQRSGTHGMVINEDVSQKDEKFLQQSCLCRRYQLLFLPSIKTFNFQHPSQPPIFYKTQIAFISLHVFR